MPEIFELFGRPLTANNKDAINTRKRALCPFYGGVCDGGGNRCLSSIKSSERPALAQYFDDKTLSEVQVGVCSMQLIDTEPPWMVCPRRLLVLGRSQADTCQYQEYAESEVPSALGYERGTHLGVWREVDIYVENNDENDDENSESFDRTFDYVVMPVCPTPIEVIHRVGGGDIKRLKTSSKNGRTFALRNNEIYVENFPNGAPSILEIMTSGTSGGDENKRAGISHAFEDAISGNPHEVNVLSFPCGNQFAKPGNSVIKLKDGKPYLGTCFSKT